MDHLLKPPELLQAVGRCFLTMVLAFNPFCSLSVPPFGHPGDPSALSVGDSLLWESFPSLPMELKEGIHEELRFSKQNRAFLFSVC